MTINIEESSIYLYVISAICIYSPLTLHKIIYIDIKVRHIDNKIKTTTVR